LTYAGVDAVRIIVILVTVIVIGWAIWQSKRETAEMRQGSSDADSAVGAGAVMSK
jgi:predicted negative regulator of RcsB-dependent stress response